jgi:oxygen-independent coproporphyrinogen-3 oxidase
MNELAIYIHWPFCKSKCPYCDFFKQVNPHADQDKIVAEYIEALGKYNDLTSDHTIKSIFFGGGTPSLMKPQNVAKIIDYIAKKWPISSNIEISLEANPNSHYANMFLSLKNAGINRLSLGIQALNDDDLRFLGRTHNLALARQCLEETVKVFSNHSADLIYARPMQTLEKWQEELAEICNYGLKHISLYQLTIEEGTVFARKNVQSLDEDAAINMYNMTRLFLEDHRYKQYEVSNFAEKGYESRHNLTYWQGGEYLGIGASAHGRLHLNGQNIATEYPFVHTVLSPEERAEELIIMGLRLTDGIAKADFHQICGLQLTEFVNPKYLDELKELHLLEETETHLRPTKSGMLVLNQVISQLCS